MTAQTRAILAIAQERARIVRDMPDSEDIAKTMQVQGLEYVDGERVQWFVAGYEAALADVRDGQMREYRFVDTAPPISSTLMPPADRWVAPQFARESARAKAKTAREENWLFAFVATMIVVAIVFASVGGR